MNQNPRDPRDTGPYIEGEMETEPVYLQEDEGPEPISEKPELSAQQQKKFEEDSLIDMQFQ